MTGPTVSSAPTSPMVNPAKQGRVWPNPGIAAAARFSTVGLEQWRAINGAPGSSKGPRPTPNSA
jgi:hypothetical protein